MTTLTVHGVLAESVAIKDRVVLEDVPSGEHYLSSIIHAFRTGRRLLLGYQKFGSEGYELSRDRFLAYNKKRLAFTAGLFSYYLKNCINN